MLKPPPRRSLGNGALPPMLDYTRRPRVRTAARVGNISLISGNFRLWVIVAVWFFIEHQFSNFIRDFGCLVFLWLGPFAHRDPLFCSVPSGMRHGLLASRGHASKPIPWPCVGAQVPPLIAELASHCLPTFPPSNRSPVPG